MATKQVEIIGEIGFWPNTLTGVMDQMRGSRDVNMLVNSFGGSLFEGLAIHSAFSSKAKEGTVTASIVGVAFSAGSLIPMAASTIEMSENATFLIHNPQGFAGGEADDLEKVAADMRKAKQSLVRIYSKRTGLTSNKISKMMDAETLLTAKEAKSFGFVDKVVDAVQIQNTYDPEKLKSYGVTERGIAKIENHYKNNTKMSATNSMGDFFKNLFTGKDSEVSTEVQNSLNDFATKVQDQIDNAVDGKVDLKVFKNAITEFNNQFSGVLDKHKETITNDIKEAGESILKEVKDLINESKGGKNGTIDEDGDGGAGGDGDDGAAKGEGNVIDEDAFWNIVIDGKEIK